MEGTGDSTVPVILSRCLYQLTCLGGGGEWKLSHRGKWGWGGQQTKNIPQQNMHPCSSEAIGE